MNQPTRLDAELSQALLKNVDNFLFDFDGVICHHSKPIAGSVECINRLKELGKKCFFVSNNSTKTRATFVKILTDIGIRDLEEDAIVCPSWVLAGYLKAQGFKDKVYALGTESVARDLEDAGIRHVGIGPNAHIYQDPAEFDYSTIQLDPEVKCVVVAYDPYFNYPKIVEATSYVLKNKSLFLATHNDPLYTSRQAAIVIPGTGTLVNAISTSVGYQPILLGKPSSIMWDILSKSQGLDAARSCMIGDNLFTDIAFSSNCCLGYSLAVFTGVTNEEEIFKHFNASQENPSPMALDIPSAKLVPKHYTNSLKELHSLIDQQQ